MMLHPLFGSLGSDAASSGWVYVWLHNPARLKPTHNAICQHRMGPMSAGRTGYCAKQLQLCTREEGTFRFSTTLVCMSGVSGHFAARGKCQVLVTG